MIQWILWDWLPQSLKHLFRIIISSPIQKSIPVEHSLVFSSLSSNSTEWVCWCCSLEYSLILYLFWNYNTEFQIWNLMNSYPGYLIQKTNYDATALLFSLKLEIYRIVQLPLTIKQAAVNSIWLAILPYNFIQSERETRRIRGNSLKLIKRHKCTLSKVRTVARIIALIYESLMTLNYSLNGW